MSSKRYESEKFILDSALKEKEFTEMLNKINSDIEILKRVLFIYAKLQNKNLFCSNIIVICKCFEKSN